MSGHTQDLVEGEKRKPLLAEITMPLEDAAKLYDVTTTSIRRWISAGKLRGYRFGDRRIRVVVEDLEAMFTPLGPGE